MHFITNTLIVITRAYESTGFSGFLYPKAGPFFETTSTSVKFPAHTEKFYGKILLYIYRFYMENISQFKKTIEFQ